MNTKELRDQESAALLGMWGTDAQGGDRGQFLPNYPGLQFVLRESFIATSFLINVLFEGELDTGMNKAL